MGEFTKSPLNIFWMNSWKRNSEVVRDGTTEGLEKKYVGSSGRSSQGILGRNHVRFLKKPFWKITGGNPWRYHGGIPRKSSRLTFRKVSGGIPGGWKNC